MKMSSKRVCSKFHPYTSQLASKPRIGCSMIVNPMLHRDAMPTIHAVVSDLNVTNFDALPKRRNFVVASRDEFLTDESLVTGFNDGSCDCGIV